MSEKASKHPTEVKNYVGSLEDLAQAVGNMRYDHTLAFIESLADDLKRQADNDKAKGRVKLAEKLYATAGELYSARDELLAAWEICKPFMKHNDK